MKKLLFKIKQLVPCTYYSKYRLPNGECYISIWKQWLGKPYDIIKANVKA